MDISHSVFNVLRALAQHDIANQRQLAAAAGMSLGSANRILRLCTDDGLAEGFRLTSQGYTALEPYKVDNAIIMAAGISARFAPLSYEKPKGLFEVRGEVLIERQIRQLKEAGITDITVVVGYMKEAFFYLEDAFGVNIVVNPTYATRNNNGTLMQVADKLRNTYICSSDNYYARNVFEPYQYQACYASVFSEGETAEHCVECSSRGTITHVQQGGAGVWTLLGYAYFDVSFSQAFLDVLRREYYQPETAPKLWEDLLAEHLRELPPMMLDKFEPGVVYEFDYLSDLCAFDRDFMANVDSAILDNICRTLACEREDIVGVEPVKAGLTNLSVLFSVHGVRYVYRHPGDGTEEIVNRRSEAYALRLAKRLGLDDTYVFAEADEGWKISRYVDGCVPFDYRNPQHVRGALELVRCLHESGETSPWSFDFAQETQHVTKLLRDKWYPFPADFDALSERIAGIAQRLAAEGAAPVMCHNDFYGPNVLVGPDRMHLIDWEYAAMGDYGCDLGNFFAQGSGYSVAESVAVLELYFGRPATAQEVLHCLACTAVVGFYWYVWAMYKESQGNAMGEWLYKWYRAAIEYANAVDALRGSGKFPCEPCALSDVWMGKEAE